MELILIISLFLIFVWWIYKNSSFRRKSILVETFPGPKALPVFGNLFEFIWKTPEEAMKLVAEFQKIYGDIYRVRALNIFAFNVTDPKIIENVLGNSTKYLNKNRLYKLLKPWLGDGLLLSKGKKWFTRRKIITPAFHFSILKQFVDVFDRQSDVLVDILSKHSTEKTINIQPFITLLALDVICETAMGVRVDAQINQDNEYVKAVATIAKIISIRLTKIWMRNDILFRFLAPERYRAFQKSIVSLHNFTNSVIRKRKEELASSKPKITSIIQTEDSSNIGIRDKMALLDVLLQSTIDGEPLSNEAIREEVDTFMFEGHDTTTAGIIFALYLISRHQSVQDELFHEITSVIGKDKKSPATFQQLTNLKYMESVIKESFRLYPPVPFIGRHLEDDIVLDDGRIIPADTHFNLLLFAMFRDPKYFKNPNDFDPERFKNVNENMNPYLFIPFSAGSRNCIGQKFAMLEVKSTISKILRYYELLPMGDEPEVTMQLILRSKNGVQLGLRNREY